MKTLIVPCAGNRKINDIPLFLNKYSDGKLLAIKSIEGIYPEKYDRIIYVVLKEVEEKYNVTETLTKLLNNIEVIVLDDITTGPAETVYQTLKKANISGEFVVRDSHAYVKINEKMSGNFIGGLDLLEYDKTVDNLRYKSFIKLNEQNQVLDIVEKQFCSNTISVGIYGFSSAIEYINTYEHLINSKYPIEKIYLSHIISYLIGYNAKIFSCVNVVEYEDWSTLNMWKLRQLIMVDLDGTLLDTRKVNYLAYKDAVNKYGYDLEYDYYCKECNGKYYMEFLPQITTNDKGILEDIHKIKKEKYKSYLSEATINSNLVELLIKLKDTCKIALVTTASKQNTYDILKRFNIFELFDLIITHEDIINPKPNPECYLNAVKHYGYDKKDCIIFEDSKIGIEAAQKAGIQYFIVTGFN